MNDVKSFRVELVAGITTFLAMSYIMFVNPSILSATGMDNEALIAVTCIVTAISSIMVGVVARSPIAMAPGMGLNAFFAYSLVLGDGIAWEEALGIVFLSGLLFLILTLMGVRQKLTEAIPKSIVYAITVGIGVFITFIGLQNLGLVIKNDATLVGMGDFTATVLIGLFGLLVMLILEVRKIKGSLLIGILAATAVALIADKVDFPSDIISTEIDIRPIAFKLDIWGALKWSLMGSIFSLMFMDMFDSLGTLVGCSNQAGKVDEKGDITGLSRLLGIDAVATMIGAVFGTSTTTAYIESGAGIEAGGRQGTTAIVVGLLFLLGLIFIPLIGIVPPYATAPALIMVGMFMMKEISNIDFRNMEEGFPAFIIIVMIALSYSISSGLALGFISFTILKLIQLKFRDVKLTMWIITALSVLFFVI